MSIIKVIPKRKAPLIAKGEIEGFGRWTLDENGLLDITGSGKMPDWEWRGLNRDDTTTPWDASRKKITNVRIAPDITSIGKYAFYRCESLTGITIPNSVINIGNSAFSWCKSLTGITIPNSVTSIGREAFRHCVSLTSVTIPDSVTSIGEHAFDDSDSLITIPHSISNIREDNITYQQPRLSPIKLPDGFDDKRMECILRSLFAELSDQEAWSLTRELSRQLEVKPLAQVLHEHLPDADHRDAAIKMAAAVDDMYQDLEQRDTGEALPLAAACYILSEEEREDPYALGLNAVALLAGRRILDAIKDANLPKNEQISAFYDYYWVFLQKDTLMQARHLREALRKYLDTDGT